MKLSNEKVPPIYKHTSRHWKELPVKGDSVGITEPKQKQGYLGDLKKKTELELEELIARQDKVLQNKEFVKKLRDGGKRLTERREQMQEVLDRMKGTQVIIMAPLPDMTALEWQWRDNRKTVKGGSANNRKTEAAQLDSDDDDDDENADPLLLMATHSLDTPTAQSNENQDKMRDDEVDPSDAIAEELRKLEIDDGTQLENASYFGSKLICSLEQKSKEHIAREEKEVFKPFRVRDKQTLLSPSVEETCNSLQNTTLAGNTNSTQSSDKHVFKQPNHKSSLWSCESSATGPLQENNMASTKSVKFLSLRESIELQRRTQEKLKALQIAEAAVRLKQLQNFDGNSKPRLHYRDINTTIHLLRKFDEDLKNPLPPHEQDERDEQSEYSSDED